MKKQYIFLVAMVWIAAVLGGTYYMMRYANTPGGAAEAPLKWPSQTTLQLSQVTPTLVLFGHPECPCSSATVGELNEIMAKVRGRLKVYVAFVVSKEDGDNKHGSLEKEAQLIPGVQTLIDEDGTLARRFDAKTSGQVLLYDEKGEIVFSGGITSARGHFGDNNGKSAVISFVNDRKKTIASTPVFGCTLFKHTDS